MTPGERIRARRIERELSIEQLAVSAGISSSTVSRIERGAPHQPGLTVLRKIAQELDLDVTDLIGVAS